MDRSSWNWFWLLLSQQLCGYLNQPSIIVVVLTEITLFKIEY